MCFDRCGLARSDNACVGRLDSWGGTRSGQSLLAFADVAPMLKKFLSKPDQNFSGQNGWRIRRSSKASMPLSFGQSKENSNRDRSRRRESPATDLSSEQRIVGLPEFANQSRDPQPRPIQGTLRGASTHTQNGIHTEQAATKAQSPP